MFRVEVKFRDENGTTRRGELVNPFRLTVEMDDDVCTILQETPTDVDVIGLDDFGNLSMFRVPTLAVIRMDEVAMA
jgi:hypothetical protein